MDEYIRRKDAIKSFAKHMRDAAEFDYPYAARKISEWKPLAKSYLRDAQTVDAVPVVMVEELIKERKELRDFAIFVADEIFETENAPDNPFDCGYGGAFAEIACRKLHKLGIVEMKGEDWYYEPTKTAQD